jgi:hypothetical protein
MSVEIGTEAAQFTEKKYINGIFLALNTLSIQYTVIIIKKILDSEPIFNML